MWLSACLMLQLWLVIHWMILVSPIHVLLFICRARARSTLMHFALLIYRLCSLTEPVIEAICISLKLLQRQQMKASCPVWCSVYSSVLYSTSWWQSSGLLTRACGGGGFTRNVVVTITLALSPIDRAKWSDANCQFARLKSRQAAAAAQPHRHTGHTFTLHSLTMYI